MAATPTDLTGIAQLYDSGTSAPDNWNFKENFVQEDEYQGTSGSFIAAESTLICAGPATAADMLSVVKIGLAPSIQISQNIPQQRIYEIGSMRCHILNGIPVGGLTISRMIYNGPSLLRAVYGNLYNSDGSLTSLAKSGMVSGSLNVNSNIALANSWNSMVKYPDKVMDADSNQQLWLSLWDQRLKLPFGLAIYMQDVSGNAAGGVYYEGCKVNSSQYGQSSGQMVMMEGISVAFDRAVPLVHTPGATY
jgi:hypothetical protein